MKYVKTIEDRYINPLLVETFYVNKITDECSSVKARMSNGDIYTLMEFEYSSNSSTIDKSSNRTDAFNDAKQWLKELMTGLEH